MWERQDIKVSLERRQSETDTALEPKSERERGRVNPHRRRGGERRTQQELNVDRLSWIIHSGLMNDR